MSSIKLISSNFIIIPKTLEIKQIKQIDYQKFIQLPRETLGKYLIALYWNNILRSKVIADSSFLKLYKELYIDLTLDGKIINSKINKLPVEGPDGMIIDFVKKNLEFCIYAILKNNITQTNEFNLANTDSLIQRKEEMDDTDKNIIQTTIPRNVINYIYTIKIYL